MQDGTVYRWNWFSLLLPKRASQDLCESFVVAAGAIENEAIDLDRRGDARIAIAKLW